MTSLLFFHVYITEKIGRQKLNRREKPSHFLPIKCERSAHKVICVSQSTDMSNMTVTWNITSKGFMMREATKISSNSLIFVAQSLWWVMLVILLGLMFWLLCLFSYLDVLGTVFNNESDFIDVVRTIFYGRCS